LSLDAILTFCLMMTALGATGAWAGALIGAVEGLEAMMGGPIASTSMNPACGFGPALASGIWTAQWLYWLTPTFGVLLAIAVNKWFETSRQ
jgi:glycerol uptake facilitator-like aquaporin